MEIRDFEIEYDFNWSYGISIDDLQKDLDELRKLGVTHIDIEPQSSYDVPYISYQAISRRMETPEEYEERIAKDKAWQEELRRRDVEQYERLKEKLGL